MRDEHGKPDGFSAAAATPAQRASEGIASDRKGEDRRQEERRGSGGHYDRRGEKPNVQARDTEPGGFIAPDGFMRIENPFYSECKRFPVTPQYYGFGLQHTGGGCMAWVRDEGSDLELWVTGLDADAATCDCRGWIMGLYFTGNDDLEPVWTVTVNVDGGRTSIDIADPPPRKRFIDTLDNPKEVGTSEYHLLHDLLTEIADHEDGWNPEIAENALREVERWAVELTDRLRAYHPELCS